MNFHRIAKSSSILSYDELSLVLDAISDGIAIKDGNGNFLILNKAYEKLMGIDRKEILGKNVNELVKKKYISESVTLKVLQSKSVQSIIQFVDRTKKELLLTGSPIMNDDGQIIRVVSVLRDMTELMNLKRTLAESLKQKNQYLEEIRRLERNKDQRIIYKSKEMQKVMFLAGKVATVDSNILVLGETGVGKELLVRYIHDMSPRSAGPFIAINCGAIPDSLIESELFGYNEGAFTGAIKGGKLGSFELSDKGTLFLDEVDALPLNVQIKLLRVLQDKSVKRLGATNPISVDFRLISATNSELEKMVCEGTFRQDLFFRLNVIPIMIPPLRERKEDIQYLVTHFLQKFGKKYKMEKKISPGAMEQLIDYNWPGNIRELENIIERLTVTSLENDISVIGLIKKEFTFKRSDSLSSLKGHRKQAEKELLIDVCSKFNSTYEISKKLGVNQSTIVRKLKEYGIRLRKNKL